MDVYTRDQVANLWRIPDFGETLLEWLVNFDIAPAFRYEGPAIAQDREKGTQTEVQISGIFYFDDLLPGIELEVATEISEYIEVKSFCATKDCQLLDSEGQIIELDSFYRGRTMMLVPLKPISIHIDDLLITQEELKAIAQEHGLPLGKSIKQKQISVRERESLLRTIGVLARMVVEQDPDRFKKQSSGKFNPAAVVTAILNHIDSNQIDTGGLGRRTLEEKLKAAFELVPKPKGE